MASNYSKGLYNDYEKLLAKYELEKKGRAEDQKQIKSLTETVKTLTASLEELKAEILRLKANNKKDSSNSSKPSSTNGYKKVITNTRQKSENKKGKPVGSSSTNLSLEKLNKFLTSIRLKCCSNNKKYTKKDYIEVYIIFSFLYMNFFLFCTFL